jgi:ATP-dependent HslUV protease ATP-binding subunit HslU
MDDKKVVIEVSPQIDFGTSESQNQGISEIQDSLSNMFGALKQKQKKEFSIKEAKKVLRNEANQAILNKDEMMEEAIRKTENEGIIFIDEIDKIAISTTTSGNVPNKDGVQRDLLPIIEGSSVHTKFGQVNTDHILFISAGAFHISKPSDLIPELQGRFPLRVELDNLNEDTLYKILTQPKNSLLKQYQALLSVEDVELEFSDDAIRALAKISSQANEKTEDIGARRLHTVIEKVLEKISFEAEKYKNEKVTITKEIVETELKEFYENEEIAHYIL